MAHVEAREGNWMGNWWMQWVASTLHTTSEHGVSSITTADAHTSAASSRLNWPPLRMDSSVTLKDEIWFLRVRPWHASELVSFLVGLRTFQHAGNLLLSRFSQFPLHCLSLCELSAVAEVWDFIMRSTNTGINAFPLHTRFCLVSCLCILTVFSFL